MSQTVNQPTSTPPRAARTIVRLILPASAAAVAAVVIAYLIFKAAGADYLVTMGGTTRTVSAAQAGLTTLLATAVGGAIALLIARRTARPGRIFTGLVAVGLVLMAANPIAFASQTLTIVALETLHLLAAGAVLAVVLPRLNRA